VTWLVQGEIMTMCWSWYFEFFAKLLRIFCKKILLLLC